MYLICINQGQGRVAPKAEVNTNQIHHIPTCVTTNLYSYWAGVAKEPLETPARIHSMFSKGTTGDASGSVPSWISLGNPKPVQIHRHYIRVKEQVHITFVNQFTNAFCNYITFVTQSAPLIRPLNIIQKQVYTTCNIMKKCSRQETYPLIMG